jgi:hypothetical protein
MSLFGAAVWLLCALAHVLLDVACARALQDAANCQIVSEGAQILDVIEQARLSGEREVRICVQQSAEQT